MAINNNGIGGPRDRQISGRQLDRPSAVQGQPQIGAPIPRRSLDRRRLDPYDLRAAFDRLKRLLRRDAEDGRQPDLPMRGYYLNVLV